MHPIDDIACDDLLLLVGTNPLPNYVAAKLLTKPGACVHLLPSAGDDGPSTRAIANQLQNKLSSELKLDVCVREVADADDVLITAKVKEICETIRARRPAARMGLHYTGGTKPMAVHAYRAVLTGFPNASFSYLDPRRLALRIDSRGTTPQQIYPILSDAELRSRVRLSLEDLASLHSYTLTESGGRPCSQALLEALAAIYAGRESYAQWKTWLDIGNCTLGGKHSSDEWVACLVASAGETARAKPRTLGQWQKWFLGLPVLTELPGRKLYAELEPFLVAVDQLRTATTLPPETPPEQVLAVHLGQETLNSCRKWLQGAWLEDYVLAILRGAAESHTCVTGVGAQCKFDRSALMAAGARSSGDRDLELDAAAMVGYQLHAISCIATAEARYAKNHLFEAFVRARQLGGDEARTALVCCVDDDKSLLAEVERDWDAKGKIMVFGRFDLPDLPAKLEQWILRATEPRGGSKQP